MPGKALGKLPSSAQQLGTLKAEMAHDKPAAGQRQAEKRPAVRRSHKPAPETDRHRGADRKPGTAKPITLDDEIARLEEQNDALTAGFARDRISVTRLLAILERLQHDMPPALAVRPDDALAAARGAMLVGATLPPVYAEAAGSPRRIDVLKATRIALVERRAEAADARPPS